MKYAAPVIVLLATLLARGIHSHDLRVFVTKMPQVVERTVQPLYPAKAWADKLVGNGAAAIRVDVYGFPTSVKLVSWDTLNSNGGSSGLDHATVVAMREWRFKPLRVHERFVPYEVRIGFVVRPEGITFTASKPEPIAGLD